MSIPAPIKYIASPYSGDPDQIAYRIHETGRFYAWLIRRGKCDPFSPILHDHTSATSHGLPTDAEFWRERNLRWLRRCDEIYLLKIDGWSKSKGVAIELEWARNNAVTVTAATPDGAGGYTLESVTEETA